MVGKTYTGSLVRSPRWLRALPAVVTVTWLLVVTYLAVGVARVFVSQLPAFFRYFPEARQGWYVALGTVGSATALAILVGLASPTWWRRAILGLAVAPVPVLLVTSQNVLAGCAAAGLLVPALWLGRELAARLLRRIDAHTAWVIGGAFGVGALALLGLTLGRIGALRPGVIWSVVLVATLALLMTGRRRLRHDVAGFLCWLKRPAVRRAEDFAVAGLLLGHYWLN